MPPVSASPGNGPPRHGEPSDCDGPDPGRTLGPGTDVPQAADQGGPRPLRAAQGDRGAVFGQIKEARGFRGSSLRGLEAVQAEWMLVVAVHNLGKLFGSGRAGRVLPGWTPTTGRATRWATG